MPLPPPVHAMFFSEKASLYTYALQCPVYNQENLPQNTQILILLGQFGLKATKHVVFSGPPAPTRWAPTSYK